MSGSLPARSSLEWLKKSAKDELKGLRARNPVVLLADAQLALAREYGIESIRRLGLRSQALVRHLIARGVSAAPEEYARLGDLQTLESIIERDPGVARSDAVMMGAVDFGHQPLVEWLLARGGNVNARARAQSRHTALHSAAWNGDLPMTRLLVDAGADVHARDEEHEGTPLDWARVAIEVTNNPKCQQIVEYLSQFTPDRTSDS